MKDYAMLVLISVLMILTGSCKTNTKPANNKEADVAVTVPAFNADSAYHFVQAQVDFGPRVPNTIEHVKCGNFLAEKLEAYGATVTNQRIDLVAFDGTILKARNIIGSYSPEKKKRVLLFAHWDTRPWADHDTDPANHRKPVLGANDGASGVGVLLEIARQIQQEAPRLGVDIIFFDAEDYGAPANYSGYVKDDWALGSQYWSRHPHVEGYNARFGILLDMVGGKDAEFYRESISEQYAPGINKKVWQAARELGYGRYFVDERTGGVTDDHLYVNTLARIPSIDIIPNDDVYSFFKHWHTLHDDMSNIDPATLKAVGQTVLQVLYNEK